MQMESRNCPNCGAPSNSEKCEYCGALIPVMQTKIGNEAKSIELWNPKAAVWWSLLFLPLGPILHHLNWKTLGKDKEAEDAKKYAIIFCIIELIWNIIPVNQLLISIAVLATWAYWGLGWFAKEKSKLATGKEQVDYVAEKYGTEYGRKSWLVPLIVSFGIMSLVILSEMIME
jgi:hypothetical protein